MGRLAVVCVIVGAAPLTLACGEDGDDIAGLVSQCQETSSDDVCEVYRLVNVERADRDLSPYNFDPHLAQAAQAHANDQVAQGYFSHESLDGRSFADRVNETAYEGFPAAENIAQGQRSPEQVMESWMGSSGHRDSILNSNYDDIGIGLKETTWVQVFGRQR